jgi:hypothetical protein
MNTKDPRKLYKQPPYSGEKQAPPGSDEEMNPKADHGESSCEAVLLPGDIGKHAESAVTKKFVRISASFHLLHRRRRPRSIGDRGLGQ